MKDKLKEQRLLIISLLFLFLLNFPVISIFNLDSTIAGIPALYCYIFALWLLMIVVIFLSVSFEKPDDRKHE